MNAHCTSCEWSYCPLLLVCGDCVNGFLVPPRLPREQIPRHSALKFAHPNLTIFFLHPTPPTYRFSRHSRDLTMSMMQAGVTNACLEN